MLVDALHLVGLDALAQVDVRGRVHRHQDGQALGRMAAAIYRTAQLRLAAATWSDRPSRQFEPPAASTASSRTPTPWTPRNGPR